MWVGTLKLQANLDLKSVEELEPNDVIYRRLLLNFITSKRSSMLPLRKKKSTPN